MLDIKFIKENREIVEAAIKNKNRDVKLDDLFDAYGKRKDLRLKLDELNQKKNEAAKARNIEEGTRLKQEGEKLEKEFALSDKEYVAMMLKIPNIPSIDTPVGKDETENKVLREWGEKPNFSFKPREHQELGIPLGLIDTETAGTLSGSRFSYLKGELVLMQFGLLEFCLRLFTNKEKLEGIASDAGVEIKVTPFTPVIPPVFVKPAVQNRMARFLSPEEHYMFPNDDLMLIGSAEHALGPIYMDKIIEEKNLPVRFVGYSTAFRREAGSHGKDTKGIIRQHQFDKLEMETFCLPEHSREEHNFLVAIQEHIVQALKLHYRVVAVCTGDMGFPNTKQTDINIWMPGQDTYRETHSADLTASFQSRRLNTRVRRADGKIEPVHMNDATAVAFGRILVAIMENYQQEDGSIKVPEILVPYVGKEVIGKA